MQNDLFDLGADLAVHSVTKYLAGHSDLIQGAVLARDPAQQLGRACTNLGVRPLRVEPDSMPVPGSSKRATSRIGEKTNFGSRWRMSL